MRYTVVRILFFSQLQLVRRVLYSDTNLNNNKLMGFGLMAAHAHTHTHTHTHHAVALGHGMAACERVSAGRRSWRSTCGSEGEWSGGCILFFLQRTPRSSLTARSYRGLFLSNGLASPGRKVKFRGGVCNPTRTTL
jgi:hypothetical protein